MPLRFSINLFVLRVRRVRENVFPPTQFGSTWDVARFLNEYFTHRKGKIIDVRDLHSSSEMQAKEYRTLRIANHKLDAKDRLISARIESGEYGTSRPIINKINGQVAYHTRTQDSDHHPHPFLALIPDGTTRIPVAIGRVGTRIPRGTLLLDMKDYFSRKNIIVELSELVDRQFLLDHLTSGRITEATVHAYKRSGDHRKFINGLRIREEPLNPGDRVTLQIKSSLLERLREKAIRIVNGEMTASELVEINGLGTVDDVIVAVDRDGRTKRFSLTRPDTAGISHPLDEPAILDATGYPNDALWKEEAAEILKSSHEVLG